MEGEGGPQMRSPILYVVRHEVWCHPRFEGSFSSAVRVGLGISHLKVSKPAYKGYPLGLVSNVPPPGDL